MPEKKPARSPARKREPKPDSQGTRGSARTGRRSRSTAEPGSRGLEPRELVSGSPPPELTALAADVESDGGVVLRAFRDPVGGHWQILAGLPLEQLAPTPYQRDLSAAHVKRLGVAIDKLDRYLDPVIALRVGARQYWTPNGNHRSAALRALGGKTILALVVPDEVVGRRILLLNTEKAHNLRERALEVIRLAEALAQLDPRPEREFGAEFDDPILLTLGACYARRGRFAGGAFSPVLKRVESFLDDPLPQALAVRRARADRLLELENRVNEAVSALEERGLQSPYLKAFVVARINPLRFRPEGAAEFEGTIAKMLDAARAFDASTVKADQLARSSGPPIEE